MTGPVQHDNPPPRPTLGRDPVAHARPGPSTICSLLAILSAAPLALVVLTDRLTVKLPGILSELGVPAGSPAVGRMLLIGGAMACLAAPLAGWLARVLPPWTVLLAGLSMLVCGYRLSSTVHSVGDLYLVRTLHGSGAGCLLAATAALVGAAAARVRPLLAAAWAAAVIGTVVADPWLARFSPGPSSDWRHQLRPYQWLLAVAAVFGIALAAASLADRRPRLYPRWVDLAALLPLAAGGPTALIALSLPRLPGRAAVLLVVVLLAGLAAIAVVAAGLTRGAGPARRAPARRTPDRRAWSADGRGAVGSATAVVTLVAAATVGPTAAGVITIRTYSLLDLPAASGGVAGAGGLLSAVAVVGLLAAVLGALLPEIRRRAVIVVGLLVCVVGALILLPAGTGILATVPGLVLLVAGNGLALGSVLRSVGPLATAVAGAVFGVTLPLAELTRSAVQSWRLRGLTGTQTQVWQQVGHTTVVAQRLWVGLVLVVTLAGAVVAAAALAISASGSDRSAG